MPLVLILTVLFTGSTLAGQTVNRVSKSPDIRAGRIFRRLNPLRPVLDAQCARANDPRIECKRLREPRKESPHPAGFYYGWYRGKDGKLHYGKMYFPSFHKQAAHNDPPQHPAQMPRRR